MKIKKTIITMFKKYVTVGILTIIIALNLFLGLSRIGTYSAVDEPYWTYGRTSKFWTAISNMKWRSTNVNDKPGITVAILSGFGLLKYDPMQYESIRGDAKTLSELNNLDNINFYFRLPIFLFCTFSLLFFYFFLKKLFGETIALLGFVFIGLSPILLGISLIINPDSLLWIFLPISMLSYLTFQKEKEKKYLVVAGISLGLSLLTKYVANILYIFFFFLPFLEYIFAEEKPELKNFLKKSMSDYLLIAAISMLTFYVLFPATWGHPKVLLEGTFLSKAFKSTWPFFVGIIGFIVLDTFLLKNKITRPILEFFSKHKNILTTIIISIFLSLIFFVMLNTYFGMKAFDFEGILSSPKGIGISENGIVLAGLGAISADIYSLIFGINPLALVFLVVALLCALKKDLGFTEEKKVVIYFSLFILLYYLASTVNDVVATVRYQIILYPLAFIISAIGASYLLSPKKINSKIKPLTAIIILCVIFIISLLSVKPFYLTYASKLLPEKYILNTKDMGDGSYEAAKYLNSLAGAHEMTIWSDKGAACSEFIGTCNIGFTKKDLSGKTFSYFIISSGRKSRSLKLSGSVNDIVNFKKLYDENTDFEKKIILGGRENNYVKIISAKSLK